MHVALLKKIIKAFQTCSRRRISRIGVCCETMHVCVCVYVSVHVREYVLCECECVCVHEIEVNMYVYKNNVPEGNFLLIACTCMHVS